MASQPNTVLLVTLGTTVEPILHALEDVDYILVLYGRPFPGQEPNPLDQLEVLRRRAADRGVECEPREIADPEDLEDALGECRAALRRAIELRPATITADFTGGTKVMSAALCHAVLSAPTETAVALQYVGGEKRDAAGRVLQEAMTRRPQLDVLTAETRLACLDLLRKGDYPAARAVASTLPPHGRNGFVRSTSTVLFLWDNFDYPAAAEALRRNNLGGGMASAFADDQELGPLADTLGRLHRAAQPMLGASKFFRALAGRQAPAANELDAQREGVLLLIADALENATRRYREGRYTDALLRCYRTVEMAIQLALLAHGKNPWGEPKIAFEQGYRAIASLAGLPTEPEPDLKEVQHLRNHSFIEHGYLTVNSEQAGKALEVAEKYAKALVHSAGGAGHWAACRTRVEHKV